MKAFCIYSDHVDEQEVVYADTEGQAKSAAVNSTVTFDGIEWTLLRSQRLKDLDDTEALHDLERTRILIMEHGWWWDDGRDLFTEDNLQAYDEKYMDPAYYTPSDAYKKYYESQEGKTCVK